MWDDAFPSFLIGLREGLEAGLIVSLLIATLVRADAKSRLPQVWTGVLAAIALALSFGAVLTFTAASLSATAQEAFGGTLSVISVAFVTAMVFWMRRSARSLSGEIKQKVTQALAMGAGMLVVTSFLAVGREGLETALFLWTTARAAGESAGPLTGAGIGLVLAAGLCWGLYRRVLKINLTRFFTATGAVLVVIAAGVLGYGLRDLQEGGVLPGKSAYAVDLSGSIDAGSWYSTLVQGVFNLTPTMTWLQVAVYVAYLATVMTLFVRGLRTAPSAKPEPAGKAPEVSEVAAKADEQPETAVKADEKPDAAQAPGSRPAPRAPEPVAPERRRPVWVVPVAVVAVPSVLAGLTVALSGSKPAGAQTVAVSETDCGKGFSAPRPGRQTFQMHNTGNKTSEVYLVDPASNAVYGEIEGLAPGTTRDLVATVAGGSYAWRCVPTGGKAVTSQAVRVTGPAAPRPPRSRRSESGGGRPSTAAGCRSGRARQRSGPPDSLSSLMGRAPRAGRGCGLPEGRGRLCGRPPGSATSRRGPRCRRSCHSTGSSTAPRCRCWQSPGYRSARSTSRPGTTRCRCRYRRCTVRR
ncbi:iron uptake transporter permease EfeU [Streptomyces sp. NPDC001215]